MNTMNTTNNYEEDNHKFCWNLLFMKKIALFPPFVIFMEKKTAVTLQNIICVNIYNKLFILFTFYLSIHFSFTCYTFATNTVTFIISQPKTFLFFLGQLDLKVYVVVKCISYKLTGHFSFY